MSKPIPFNQVLRIAAKEAIASDPDIVSRLGLKRLQEIKVEAFSTLGAAKAWATRQVRLVGA